MTTDSDAVESPDSGLDCRLVSSLISQGARRERVGAGGEVKSWAGSGLAAGGLRTVSGLLCGELGAVWGHYAKTEPPSLTRADAFAHVRERCSTVGAEAWKCDFRRGQIHSLTPARFSFLIRQSHFTLQPRYVCPVAREKSEGAKGCSGDRRVRRQR